MASWRDNKQFKKSTQKRPFGECVRDFNKANKIRPRFALKNFTESDNSNDEGNSGNGK